MRKIWLSMAVPAALAYGGAELDYRGANVIPMEKRSFEQSKFIPDISLIMDASYVNRDIDDDQAAHLEIPGIAHGLLGSHAHGDVSHATYNAANGFNLNYGELVLSSSVDPFFEMQGVFHLSENGFHIEELFFTSNALGNGLMFKGGKFNSNFGYLNEQHHHIWDFADMPLVYESFLGMHGLNEKGAQLQWTAPTPFYLMVGGEVLQGENEQMFGIASIGDAEAPIAERADAPAMFVGYVKASYDIEDTTLFGGLSFARGSSRLDHSSDETPHAFSGMSSLYGADLVVKHYFDSYSFLSWQSEYLKRDMDGTIYAIDPDDTTVATGSAPLTKEQAGLYTQLVYAYDKNWRTGVRYDRFTQNDVIRGGVKQEQPGDLDKYTAMVEYHTSEFARFRLQFDRNNAFFDEAGGRRSVDSIILQANIAIGAHAAHSF